MRCTGHCCKRFFLPVKPEEIVLEQENLAAGRNPRWEDGHVIADMVIPVADREQYGYFYTCKHFDAESGNCKNYENRPKMCSAYPYGGACTYEGCTMKNRGKCHDFEICNR